MGHARRDRHRFTSHSAPHDPSIVMNIMPASATDISVLPAAASDEDPSINGLSIITITKPPSWAARKTPTNETTMFTIQPSPPRFLVHASWSATASAAAKKASAITKGPPTLDSGIEPVN